MSIEETHSTETPVDTTLTKRKRAPGGQIGNGGAIKHGVYTIIRLLKEGALDGRTTLAKWRLRRIDEYVSSQGGEGKVGVPQKATIEDTVDLEIVQTRINDELNRVKRLYRRGKPHPLLDILIKVSRQITDNRKAFKVLGGRVPPAHPTFAELLAEQSEEEEAVEEQRGNGED